MSSELGAPGSPDPAPGAAIQRRLEARGEGAPRVIAVQGAGSVAGRVVRLAQTRLPLLDALQRRWGASAAWPGMPELPLVTPLADAAGAPAGKEAAAPPAANPAETDSPGRAGLGVIGRPSGPQLAAASLTPTPSALSARAAQPVRAAGAETSGASGARPTGLVQTQADENAPTVPAAPIPTVSPGSPGTPSPDHVPPSVERRPDAARADLPLASGGLGPQAQFEAQPAPAAADAASSTALPLVSPHPSAPRTVDPADIAPARAATNEPGHGASGSLPPASFVPAASAVPQGFVQEAPSSPAGSPLGQSQTRPESVPPGSSITPVSPAELPLSPAKPGLRAKREAQPGTVPLATEPATPSAAPASASDLPVVTPSLAWPAHSAAARAGSAAQAADIIQASSDATQDVIAGQPPVAAQAARAVMSTPAEPAASAGAAPSVPVVGPALPPPTPAAAQAQPAPGSPTIPAATAELPLPIVQARRAGPARAPEVQAFAPSVRREASAELSAPEVSGAATPPVARTQPATIERAQPAPPIVQQAAAPVRVPAIDTTAPGLPISRSPSTSGVAPPAPGVVRVWGAPIVQRSAAGRPDAQAAAETRRGSPLGRSAARSGGSAPAAQSAGGSSIAAGGPLPGTVARTPGGESAAPEALPLAGQGDSTLPTARTVSSPVAAASGITSGDAGAGSPQTAAARAIQAAPPRVAGAPATELRLARPGAASRLAEPPADIMQRPPARAVPIVAPAVASALTAVGAPGVVGVPAAAPTLQLAAQGTSAPATASSAAQEAPPAASGVTATPPQESTAPPPRRLDETEMARVVDAVLTTLQQRLQLERESRGL